MSRGAVYDTGALIAAERGNAEMVRMHRRLLDEGSLPVVPHVVLAQAWRGGPQGRLSWMLDGCRTVGEDEKAARLAGVACALTRTSDVVDALVVVTAMSTGSTIVTSDPDDLRRLAWALHADVPVVTIG